MSPATNSIDDDELDAEALLLPPSVIEGLPLPTPEPGPQWDVQERHRGIGSKGFMIRALALLCACSLSIGSHYGSYFLGPLKSRLSREIGTSNAQFSLLISAFSLNSTWTPLVGGLLASYLGTAVSSIIATSIILLGQAILLAGELTSNVTAMAVGMFVFGLGISPLAVVQETIIVRFFATKGLGISLALGLVAGKGASFISARTSYPLSEAYGPHAPFIVSTILATFSFCVNIIYVSASSWFARGADVAFEPSKRLSLSGAHMTEAEARRKVAEKRRIRLKDVTRLGDAFWAYMAINVLCGAIWSPFTHLAANMIELRYDMTEGDAGAMASLLLAGSIFLYPICGYVTDRAKSGPIVHYLFILSSILTLFCYFWLILPPSWTKTPLPGILAYATGHGFSTLLLVIIVPHLVPLRYVSTALGAHKSIEQAGSTISQTLAGLVLDSKHKTSSLGVVANLFSKGGEKVTITDPAAVHTVLITYFIINIVQFLGTIALWRLDARRKKRAARKAEALLRGERISMSDVIEPSQSSALAPVDMSDDEDEHGNDTDAAAIQKRRRKHRYAGLTGSWSRRTRPLIESGHGHGHGQELSRGSRYLLAPALCAADGLDETGLTRKKGEKRRGKMLAMASVGVVACAWVLFMGTAWAKLRAKGSV
ncbi:MFS general substrate transporter [Exidia glandulosa HHB12029]|uniref:Lysosomal dipeptide transporter MFSD1 n=1 Tax=Exidia glandulosa HHB12029 TaxID=1314781 RepID=A0A165PP56_EXIGL|nr:MFS general substrate transporter [Exidia glandulosa HHB12029]